MSQTAILPEIPLPRPEDHSDPNSYAAAMRRSWVDIGRAFDPFGSLAAPLHMAWVQHWYSANAERIQCSLDATAGVGIAELRRAVELGGLARAIADNRTRQATINDQAAQISAYRDCMDRLAKFRRENPDLDAAAAADRMSLLALEAFTYGPVVAAASADDAPSAPSADAAAPSQGEPAPSAAVGPDDAVTAEPHRDVRRIEPLRPGMAVFPAAKFQSMAAVRGLTDQDGEAFWSDGKGYDSGGRLDLLAALPIKCTHVAWVEYGAGHG